MYYAWCEDLIKRKRADSMHNQELSLIMATQFVKWWKTKFHVGGCSYKSISVLGSNVLDGRRSDTEELVRDDTSCNGHINPGLASSSVSEASATPQYLHQHSTQVKFEDFECDVQVEGCEGGEEKKEFSFTFYDLDGHGKITKDDIAGLVRSIYGAVNDSITVPQGGKKTIKVRLTVTPEKGGRKEDLIQEPELASNNNINNNISIIGMGNSSSNDRPRNNVNVTIKENLNRDRLGGGSARREKELRDKLSHLDRPKFHSVRLPNQCRGCNVSPDVCASPLRNRKKWRERCSLQRPDIFELLQANMEKNNVNPCCRREHPQQLHHSIAPCTNSQETCPVLPLLNENFCKGRNLDNSFRQQYLPHIHRSSHNHSHHHQHQHQCRKQHHRSRSHDLSQNLFRHHSFNERDQNQCCNLNLETQDPLDILEGFVNHQFSQNRNKNTNLAAAQASATPHQLKHRNRQQEHERAMAQVISWLERENIGGYEKKFGAKRNNPSTNSLLGSPPQVKKHEHHHVHEHIHHHYHHHFGKETPIIV